MAISARDCLLGCTESSCFEVGVLLSLALSLEVIQVWRALCIPYNEEVAVKLLDLENVNCSLVSAIPLCCARTLTYRSFLNNLMQHLLNMK